MPFHSKKISRKCESVDAHSEAKSTPAAIGCENAWVDAHMHEHTNAHATYTSHPPLQELPHGWLVHLPLSELLLAGTAC